jgi:hypothetical protein
MAHSKSLLSAPAQAEMRDASLAFLTELLEFLPRLTNGQVLELERIVMIHLCSCYLQGQRMALRQRLGDEV